MKKITGLMFLVSALVWNCGLLSAEDLTMVRDHALISRFPGSEVQEFKKAELDEFVLPLGPIVNTGDRFAKSQALEGKVTKFKYSVPANRSTLEIHRSYSDALTKAGFQTLYTCERGDCISPKFPNGYTSTGSGIWCFNCEEPMRFVAAKLSRPTGDVYVSVAVVKDKYEGGTWVTIVETKPATAPAKVTVNAAALSKEIGEAGHAPVYGIYFDSGTAVVNPESTAALDEIARMMTTNAQLKLMVVGHTDNVGAMASNMSLSKQRADAVVAALVDRFHIAPARLQAQGAGSVAPVTSNRSEDGRAKNRRVELVEQ